MNEKDTIELEKVLGSTHLKHFGMYCQENKESVVDDEKAFVEYYPFFLLFPTFAKNLIQYKLFLFELFDLIYQCLSLIQELL